MKINLRAPVATLVAILVGLIVLLGYFLPAGADNLFLLLRARLLAAVALLMGIVNLLNVHFARFQEGGLNPLYSGALIVSLVLTLLITLLQGPNGRLPRLLFDYIQVPVETSLTAVLAVSLAYAVVRLLHRRPTVFSLLFVLIVFLTLLGSVPFFGFQVPIVSEIVQPYLTRVFALAGARGILLGVALGTVATGLRVLMGVDRPFGG